MATVEEVTKKAFYFGCWKNPGHFLYDTSGRVIYDKPHDLPWNECIMDGQLLNNGKVPDVPTGEVFWTCGGKEFFWFAFYWWDRSVDKRWACNSGFYVRGFSMYEVKTAFSYACQCFPHIVSRQHYPLVLQNIYKIKPKD